MSFTGCMWCIHASVKLSKYPCNECVYVVVNGNYVDSKDHFVDKGEKSESNQGTD